jgi:hypothetical protein
MVCSAIAHIRAVRSAISSREAGHGKSVWQAAA